MTQDATVERVAVVKGVDGKCRQVKQTAEVQIELPGGLPSYDRDVIEASAWRIVRLEK